MPRCLGGLPRLLQPWFWNRLLYTTLIPSGRAYASELHVLHKFTRDVIQARRTAHAAAAPKASGAGTGNEDTTGKKKPFLDMLLEATDDDGQPLSDAGAAPVGRNRTGRARSCVPMGLRLGVTDVQEEVDTFMFEGHDTVRGAWGRQLQMHGAVVLMRKAAGARRRPGWPGRSTS
jgi:hypothetical protein